MPPGSHTPFASAIALAIAGFAACAPPPGTGRPPTATAEPSSLSPPSSTLVHMTLPTPIPTVPTLSAHDERRMIESLQSDDCQLPCYLGIRPGLTALTEARELLDNLGANYYGEYTRQMDGSTFHSYSLVVGSQFAGAETPRPGERPVIYHRVELVTNDEMVDILEVYVNATSISAIAEFRDYWSRYTTRGIFLQVGQPDQIYIDRGDPESHGRILLMEYTELGALTEVFGTAEENGICPEREGQFVRMHLSLYNTAGRLSIYSGGRVPPTDRDVWVPLEEALGIDSGRFYQHVISRPSACFKLLDIEP